ncbi:uncharacterized protein LOC122032112 [Zingiber officinale]|uniref:C2 domain-containing protein n=1 Tax=Zingiber officinale TaxID=94328 RepID=A0A8J5C8Y0_ZINOF|nr:uncharacterized protein LOC122032112 [Zingiber officinale]XP_042447296.1 uncharacterized protein LOC122032112 [Zingiber officinale]XP_042447297.1 uncharacterized protein LOC122032112 [Zingiber officinale]XP_042447298.1 uncharacterized protein LOC122032112 [Zingiber officinale]XP_042447299.1 uncharacterized protein LOC122032112 [Zingiber officinale]KAG6470829.1 hypothetical protein ZIOFF_071909 [Zingiber officinale]
MEIVNNSNTFAGELTHRGFAGFLDVFVHQARDLHNICIYHKQDVYAKLCLTSDPDVTVSTRTINGGGQNPIFDEQLRLCVRTVESSLKCEIWMLSKVKNYLEDQLLGFALVPLADVLVADGKLLAQEFSLSSTDLFHSPAGFIQLSLSYAGASPDVMAIPRVNPLLPESTLPETENPHEYQKIEFPDLKVAKENHMMISEYFGLDCSDVETQCAIDPESCNREDEEAGVRLVESFSGVKDRSYSTGAPRNDTPVTSASTSDSSPLLAPTSPSTSRGFLATATPSPKEKNPRVAESEADSNNNNSTMNQIIRINIEPEETVVQQEIVDMYMKSMQQFTESLANMKLPMDVDGNSSSTLQGATVNSDERQATVAAKGIGSRVFYGSRAFF